MPRRSEVSDPQEYNRLTAEEFRANKGKTLGDFEGRPILLLTTVGREDRCRTCQSTDLRRLRRSADRLCRGGGFGYEPGLVLQHPR